MLCVRRSYCCCHHLGVTTSHNPGTRPGKRLTGANRCKPNTGSAIKKLTRISPLRWKDTQKACPCTRTAEFVLLHPERASVLKPFETEAVTAHTCKCYATAAGT